MTDRRDRVRVLDELLQELLARADALSLASSVRRHEEPDAEVVERALLYRVGP